MRRSRILLALTLVFSVSLSPPGWMAETEPPDLTRARTEYQRELEFVSRPANQRYLRVLEQLKRSLGAKGDARGAIAVQEEIERIDPASAIARLAGKWTFRYSNGWVRVFVIDQVGNVSWIESDGNRLSPSKKTKIINDRGNFIMEWQPEDRIEKVSLIPAGLHLDHFYSPEYRAGGSPGQTAIGTLSTTSK